MRLTKSLLGVLALSALTPAVFAQDTDTAVAPLAPELQAVCDEFQDANMATLEAMRAARPDVEAMRALLMAALARAEGNNICIADMLGEGDEDIAEMLAETADSGMIEPAAGPAGGPGGEEFPADPQTGTENPSQLNTPVQTPPASPSAPASLQ